MNCAECGHQNRESARFCEQCGTPLAQTCPGCGAELRSGVRFCDGCGQSLGGAPQEVARSGEQAQPAAPPLPLSFASGRYRVERFLGEGAKKQVYLARDTRIDRDVAIGAIKVEGLDEASHARLQREAQAMGRLGSHPHVVTIFDISEEGGQPYIVSEYMAGGSVESLLHENGDHRLPLEDVLRIGDELAQALQYAHAQGIVHRDLKPGNVWLAEDGSAKLGDFGLARAAYQSKMTTEGSMLGTVAYMPPEQALGNEASPQSDLYSLGAVLYERVTGRPPFVGDDAVGVISQHLNQAPVAPSWHRDDCPRDLEELSLALLAKAGESRGPPRSRCTRLPAVRNLAG